MTMRRTGDVRCRGVSRIMSGYPKISISRDVPGYPALLLLYCILVLSEYTTLMSTVHHSHEYTTLTVCACASVPPSHFAEMLLSSRPKANFFRAQRS